MAGVYEAMREAGELSQLGGRVVPVGPFLAEPVRRYGRPQAIAADRWRAGELEDGVRAAGLNRLGAGKDGKTARWTGGFSGPPFLMARLLPRFRWPCGRPLPRRGSWRTARQTKSSPRLAKASTDGAGATILRRQLCLLWQKGHDAIRQSRRELGVIEAPSRREPSLAE